MKIFEKCREFTKVDEYKQRGLYPYFVPIAENNGTRVKMNGREVLMIGSNNYLGLTKDPRVQEAAIKAVEKYGTSCSGSRFLNGTYELHEELEARLARFVNKEAALVFGTGYQTNAGAISTLLENNSIIITDKTNHSSIFDGVFLGAALNPRVVIKRYRHNDMEDLERVFQALNPDLPKLIVTDGVFSMEGDVVKLPRMIELCQQYGCGLYLDDAHGLGVVGKTGRGTMEHYDKFNQVDVVMSTFSKTFSSLGGFVAGKKEVINYIKHFSRQLIFSAAIPPANTASVLKVLEIMETEPQHVARLQEIGSTMRREFQALGFDTGESETPIIPILVRDFDKTFAFWSALFEAGIYTNAVVPPGVPADRSLLRTSYMAIHTDDDLQHVLSTFKKIGKGMGII